MDPLLIIVSPSMVLQEEPRGAKNQNLASFGGLGSRRNTVEEDFEIIGG